MIQLDAVTVRFDAGAAALEKFSLDVQRGELLALVGPSGSGKTTALRVMNALQTPTRGNVRVDDQPITTWSGPELRRQMGYVIQDVGLFPHWTVERNIACVPRLLAWDVREIQQRTSELIRSVGLADEHLSRYPSQLSGGQRQRVGIARALAARPRYLLLDEPFGAVDPLTRLELRRLLQKLRQEQQLTCVMVTHDLQDALTLADRIAILRAGRLVQLSTPAELRAQPVDPWAAEFLAAGGLAAGDSSNG